MQQHYALLLPAELLCLLLRHGLGTYNPLAGLASDSGLLPVHTQLTQLFHPWTKLTLQRMANPPPAEFNPANLVAGANMMLHSSWVFRQRSP